MEQLILIETPTRSVEYFKGGMLHRNHGTWEERNFRGYRQTRYHGEPWQFYISGFSGPQLPDGSDGTGHVLLFNGDTRPCQMDLQGRVRIHGHWYSQKYWDH